MLIGLLVFLGLLLGFTLGLVGGVKGSVLVFDKWRVLSRAMLFNPRALAPCCPVNRRWNPVVSTLGCGLESVGILPCAAL